MVICLNNAKSHWEEIVFGQRLKERWKGESGSFTRNEIMASQVGCKALLNNVYNQLSTSFLVMCDCFICLPELVHFTFAIRILPMEHIDIKLLKL